MRRLRGYLMRALDWALRRRSERHLSEELESHVQLHADEEVRRGVHPVAARRRALIALGGMEQARQQYRDRRDLPLYVLLADLRYAARGFRRQPGFTVAAVLTLALGIGATTGLFSIVDALLLKPLAVDRPGDLVRLLDDGRESSVYPAFDQLRQHTALFAGLAAATRLGQSRRVEISGVASRVAVQEVSDNYFEVLGLRSTRGRFFTRADESASTELLAVISDAFWRQQYRGENSAIGTAIRYLNRDYTIVGIAPPAFRGVNLDLPADVWVPLDQAMPAGSIMRTRGRFLQIVGRLQPGVSATEGARQVTALLGRPVQLQAGSTGFSALRGQFGRPLLILQLAVVAVLLITCVNLANLMLARTIARGRDFAVRRALGASRGRIVRQVLTECGLLCGAGAALALVLASWLNSALLNFLPPEDAAAVVNLRFHPDLRLLTFLAVVSGISVIASGLLPALRATAMSSPELRVRASSGHAGRRLTSRVLAISEIALSTFLVIGSALFVRTLWNLWSVDAGFETRDVIVADLAPSQGQAGLTWAELEELRATTAVLPGVRAVGISAIGQMTGYGIEFPVHTPGESESGREVTAYEQRVSPGFFDATGIGFRGGRDFNDRDVEVSPQVAIVNESFVRQFLRSGATLGQRFGEASDKVDHLEIVGVVEDSKWVSLREAPVAMYYRPFRQRPASSATLVVSAPGVAKQTLRALSELARLSAGRLVISDIVPFGEIVDRTLGRERMLAQVSAALGLLALAVVAVGLYGVLAYDVAQRTREIGVRLALGATRAGIACMIMRGTGVILAIGLPIGVAASWLVAPAVASLLFGLTSTDPWTIAGGVVILTAVALLATYLPTRRAVRIEPFTALRME